MRRHDALIPLSHDHHHALAHARQLRECSKAGDVAQRCAVADEFLRFFDTDTIAHFREEEELLFPSVVTCDGLRVDLLERVLLEHVRIHAMVTTLRQESGAGDPAEQTLFALGDALTKHVRFEENELFPHIEELVADEVLNNLGLDKRIRNTE